MCIRLSDVSFPDMYLVYISVVVACFFVFLSMMGCGVTPQRK